MTTADTTTSPLSSLDTIELFSRYVIPNYKRYPVSLVKGEGSLVWDAEGKEYLDLFPGWGCNILGYSHPGLVHAIKEQVDQLIHVPNTWYTEQQGRFAEAICSRSFGKAFFCNSGAEAIEGALKLARLHTSAEKYKFITFQKGFHGRTFGAVSATAQPKYHEGLGPLVPGFKYAPYGNLQAVADLIDHETCAILIEPVQGEGGVNLPPEGFLQGLRDLADEHGLVLIFDEIQSGTGRLGTWFGHQYFGVQPDIFTLAKGVAGGVACGGFVCRDEIAPSLRPGMHASTFGGNSLAMAAGIATFKAIEEEGLLGHISDMADWFREEIATFAQDCPIVRDVRVCGMMIGIELTIPASACVQKCMDKGVLINVTQETVIRLLPAYNLTKDEGQRGLSVIFDVIRELSEAV